MLRSMTLYFALLCCVAITSLLQGCGDSGVAKAAGTYELDTAAMRTAMQAEIDKIEDPMERMGASMMLGMLGEMSMTITLNADGTASGVVVIAGEEDPATGNWTLTGNNISITMGSEGESNPETMSGTYEGDTIRLDAPGDEMPVQMVLKRKTT